VCEVQTARRKHRCQQDGNNDFVFHGRFRLQMTGVYGAVLGVVDGTVGIVGAVEPGPTVPPTGNALGVGIVCAALTPRLPIS
jgi:hypothetical protein